MKVLAQFGAHNIPLKKLKKFTSFIVYLWLKSHKIVRESTHLIDFLSAIF